MIERLKVIKANIKNLGQKIATWWNSILCSIKEIFNKIGIKFKEKVIAGISLKLTKKDGKFLRENHIFFETKDGYSKTVVASEQSDVLDEYQFLNEGGTIDITKDFEEVLELEY